MYVCVCVCVYHNKYIKQEWWVKHCAKAKMVFPFQLYVLYFSFFLLWFSFFLMCDCDCVCVVGLCVCVCVSQLCSCFLL